MMISSCLQEFSKRLLWKGFLVADQEGENAPVITHAFASKEVRQGETWKVFLQAQDADGDMNRIVCTLEQPGVGVQPVSLIKIREGRRRNLSGYIFLNTGSASGFQFASCRLTVQIQDQKGNAGNSVSFPLTLNPRAVQQSPPPGVFEDEALGPVQALFPAPPGP
jgi:hypothetical protein